MIRTVFLYNSLLCLFMLFLNLKKIGLKNKTSFIPSTFFWIIWFFSSLGCYLFANGYLPEGEYYKYATNLDLIGYYQLTLLTICAFGFLLARFTVKNKSINVSKSLNISLVISKCVYNLRWILYSLFFVGMIRLITVVSETGFDYNSMRSHYIMTRTSWSELELWINRIGLYLVQANRFYICLLGFAAAVNGLKIKKTIRDFILFSPFQIAYGGRLFILSFFMPFMIGYLVAYSLFPSMRKRGDIKKFIMLGAVPLSLIVIVQSFKLGVDIEKDGFGGQYTQFFYSTSIYQFLNEFFREIDVNAIQPTYGRCTFSAFLGPSPQVTELISYWADNHISAAICVPSMIPDLLLDYGIEGSYVVAFIVVFLIERYALNSLCKMDIRKFFIYITLCVFCFGMGTTSFGDSIKMLTMSLIIIFILNKSVISKIK